MFRLRPERAGCVLRMWHRCDSIWLTEIDARVPESVELDRLDISLNAAPPAEWLPSNVTLKTWDVKEDAPGDLVEAYDIVLQTAATV
ncbi:hypothetical protein BU26DRAFT_99947 [Trematosphaeria pertusa]|uniref:Uncharacterized protein n=1 Tax=Trematosphaeria pertusa TaxID=390896 RepID=A0A6A6I1K9_9PLEO|nr:uncharacterized protein BU26DRAFT_99947 [Trematosphaeria pertusa]KAF2244384.1 hypothetical protein BU26DRAFT_99947 [Trematosphaeria pertusa]